MKVRRPAEILPKLSLIGLEANDGASYSSGVEYVDDDQPELIKQQIVITIDKKMDKVTYQFWNDNKTSFTDSMKLSSCGRTL